MSGSSPARPRVNGPLRVGVMGTGFMGETHLAAWAAEGIRAVIHDVDAGRAATLAERYGAGVAATREELFSEVDVGDVVAVHCRSAGVAFPGAGVDHAVAILTHRSGAISHVSASWGYAPPTFTTAFEIAGSHGLIEQSSTATTPVMPSLLAGAANGGTPALADTGLAGDPFRLELAEFAGAIRDGTDARISAEDGLEALRIALAADESARTGVVVRIGQEAG